MVNATTVEYDFTFSVNSEPLLVTANPIKIKVKADVMYRIIF